MRSLIAAVLITILSASCSRSAFSGLSYATLEGTSLLAQWCALDPLPVRLGEVRLCADDPLPADVSAGSVEFKVVSVQSPFALEFRVQGLVVNVGSAIAPTVPGQSGGKAVLCALLEVFGTTAPSGSGSIDIEVKARKTDGSTATSTQRVTFALECTPVVAGPSLIAYWSYAGGNSGVYTLRADGSGLELRTPGSALIAEIDPAISHDRARIAFVGNRDLPGDDYELYVVTLATGVVDRMSFDAAGGSNLRAPCWAPDATGRIVVEVRTPGAGGLRIYDIDTPGTFFTLTTSDLDHTPCWHPDPALNLLVFERNGDLYTVNPPPTTTPVPQLLLNRLERLRQPSYEGIAPYRLAFASEIGLQIYDGTNPPIAVTNDPFHDDPAWSPDGTELLFGGVVASGPAVFRMSSAGGAIVQFGGGSCLNPDWR